MKKNTYKKNIKQEEFRNCFGQKVLFTQFFSIKRNVKKTICKQILKMKFKAFSQAQHNRQETNFQSDKKTHKNYFVY